MTKVLNEELKKEERDLIRAINQNEERLNELWGTLAGIKQKRSTYVESKKKCTNLKSLLTVIGSQQIIILGAVSIAAYLKGNPTLGNAIFEIGAISLLALPIIYDLKTRKERKFISQNNPHDLRIEQYRNELAISRRRDRSNDLREELNHVRSMATDFSYTEQVSPVIGEVKSYERTK